MLAGSSNDGELLEREASSGEEGRLHDRVDVPNAPFRASISKGDAYMHF